LIVSVAILGILATAALTIMSSGIHTYDGVFDNVSLQVESQTVMNQIEQAVINCNGGICFQNDALYLVDEGDMADQEKLFRVDAGQNSVEYEEYTVTVSGGSVTKLPGVSGRMATHVQSLHLIQTKADLNGRIFSVSFGAEFTRNGKTYYAEKTVAPRNHPICASSENELISAVCR
jgi:hypothetical protein